MFSGLGQVICEKCSGTMRIQMVEDLAEGIRSVVFECVACLHSSAFEYGPRHLRPVAIRVEDDEAA